MLKILNDKSIKYRRFSSIMIEILDKKFLFAIIILTSCNQKIESNTEASVDENKLDIIEYEIPLTFEEDFETDYNLDEWTEFRILKSNILVLANSISGYNDNDAKYLEDILNKLGNNSREVLKSDFDLFNISPEIKGRLKLLEIQIQKTKHNLSKLNKSEGIEELNKIFVYYNYSANMIESKLVDSINKNTFVLIVKNKEDESNKTKKAKELNIPIMEVDEFKKKYM